MSTFTGEELSKRIEATMEADAAVLRARLFALLHQDEMSSDELDEMAKAAMALGLPANNVVKARKMFEHVERLKGEAVALGETAAELPMLRYSRSTLEPQVAELNARIAAIDGQIKVCQKAEAEGRRTDAEISKTFDTACEMIGGFSGAVEHQEGRYEMAIGRG